MNRLKTRLVHGVVLAISASLLAAATASAHVTLRPNTTAAGAYAYVQVSVPHGCGADATEVVRIQIPEELERVTPQRNPGWDLEVIREDAPDGDDAHGGDNGMGDDNGHSHGDDADHSHGGDGHDHGHGAPKGRITEVVWRTSDPLPSDVLDIFGMSVRWPDAAGTELAFPAIQECEGGSEAAWVEPRVEGEDEPPYPVPTVLLTEGDGHGHGHGHGDDADATEDDEVAAGDDADDAAASGVAWAGVGLGGLALLVALGGWIRGGRSS